MNEKLWLGAGLWCLAAAACADPTEVVVFVDTTLAVPCAVDTFRITVEGAGAAEVREANAADGQASLTVVKDSGGNNFTVQVEGLVGGAVVASGTANVAFQDGISRQVALVLDETCREAPCDFTESLGDLATPPAASRASCEDVADRYTFAAQTGLVEVVDACDLSAGPFQRFTTLSSEEVRIDDETLAGLIADDFDFRLYGEPVNQVWVTDDGYVSFGAQPSNATFDRVTNSEGITSPGHPERAVLGFWDDLALSPDDGAVCAAMVSAGGRNTLWVSWTHACIAPCNPADDLNFSIGLEEETNRITIGFGRMESLQADRAAAAGAVVGVIGAAPLGCDAGQCSAEGTCADGTPCGFTEVISRTRQTDGWPATFVLRPASGS